MPDHQITYSKFKPQYLKDFYNLLDAICKEKKYLAFTESPPVHQLKQFVYESLEKGSSNFYALVNNEIIGWCDIVPNSLEGFTHSGKLGMGIHQNFRGKGIGKNLATLAIKDAFENNITRIELEVYESNIPAINLYFKLGFKLEGRKINARFYENIYENILIMALVKD